MNIIVNGEQHKTNAQTLNELCAELGMDTTQVATALNGNFVPQPERTNIALKENDKIEILSARQGG